MMDITISNQYSEQHIPLGRYLIDNSYNSWEGELHLKLMTYPIQIKYYPFRITIYEKLQNEEEGAEDEEQMCLHYKYLNFVELRCMLYKLNPDTCTAFRLAFDLGLLKDVANQTIHMYNIHKVESNE